MNRSITLALGAALLMGVSGAAYASGSNTNGASKFAPGQIQKNSTTGVRANDVAPGQIQKNSTTGARANDFAPGQRNNPTSTSTTRQAR